jgi:uncharacterized protein DUF642/PEP-CTERM motif-containing protein
MPNMKSVVLLQMLAVPAMWANLLTNGGFEQPHVTGATSESFPVGSTDITGWLVVPFPPADVSLIRDDFTIGNLTFLPHSGTQSINLTGDISGEAAGVLQKVKLQIGDEYKLTFWVGNQDNSAKDFMMDATVGLVINNDFVHMYTNGDSSHHALNWKEFSYTFTATKISTSIEFENLTLPNEYYVGLDDANLVDLTPQAGTPEPKSLWLAGLALLAAGWRRRIWRCTPLH